MPVPSPRGEYALHMHGISKHFGGVQALTNVDLELRRGELLGLVGDNAAGKSTLMKIAAGAVVPDQGHLRVDGRPVTLRSPADARTAGIEMIYQDLALFDDEDVAANIFMGRERVRRVLGMRVLDRRAMWEESARLLERLNINVASPRLSVRRMSGGQRQMIALAQAVAFESKILILDEPTAALGVREANTLLEFVQTLKHHVSMIMITQRIPEVLAIADRVMVLKGGVRQGVLNVPDTTLEDVVSLIVGGRTGDDTDPEFMSFG
jgi:ribose transport system ATP-binding protein